MSKLTRALVLGAMLAAMSPAGMTAVAQAHPTAGDAAQLLGQGERASQQQTTTDDAAKRQALAQERYYNTWRMGARATSPVRPVEQSRQPSRLVVTLGVLAAALVLLGVLAATIARNARRRVRARHAA